VGANDMTVEMFIEELKKQNIDLNQRQIEQFSIYYNELIEWNKRINLTSITDQKEVYLKHFYDSLTLAFDYQLNNQSICDIGAGAGFPSIPLKIVYPSLKITIVDSLHKRITFLQHLSNVLDLTNVEAIASRAEEYGRVHREKFDIVSARAVARLHILDELCLPLVKLNGVFIALKGSKGKEEVEEASNGIQQLGGKIEKVVDFNLPISHDERINIYIRKVKKTSSLYPRHYSKIKKTPL